MPMPAMRAGDVIRLPQRRANPHGHRFFPDVQVRQARHQGPRIKLVHTLFKLPNRHHAPVNANPLLRSHAIDHSGLVRGNGHWEAPDTFVNSLDIRAKTSNTIEKTMSYRAITSAAVEISVVLTILRITHITFTAH